AGELMLAQLELPPALVREAFAAQKAAGGATMLNAAPALAVPGDLFALSDYLVLNETELATYTDRALKADAPASVVKAAALELRRPGQKLIVTLGARGALAVDGRGALSIPARAAQARDTTGAGDCFCGALAARLAEGAALTDSLEFAAAAAAISVTRDGAAPSMPDRAEIDAALA
ncbi:MAG: PfkB family carbohydrate kinase, partial [Paracoccaceae bacterium]